MYKETEELIKVGKDLHQRGWLPATGGNLSAKVEDNLICISASGTHKGHLNSEDFVFVDMDGNVIKGNKKPSAETLLHILAYKRFNIKSVLHIHSVNSTLISRFFSVSVYLEGYELLKAFDNIDTHESIVEIPIFDNNQDMIALYERIEKELKDDAPGFLLRSHGLYVWGRSILDVYVKLEAFDFLFECELKAMSLRR